MLRRFALLSCVLIAFSPAVAANQQVQHWIALAHQQNLSLSSEWLNLVHYRPDILDNGYTSFADDPAFFLAADGKTNPQAELEATLQALSTPLGEGNPDKHAQCRFVARYHWLKQKLSIADSALPQIPCPEYEEWYQTINPGHVTLVFPSAYINNPSSMFGHTLLRIDPPDNRHRTPLTGYSISYAAETTEFNGLVFAIKGLAGGYAGYFSIQPYYDKVNEYRELENRDIWEYELNFTPAEVQRLMEHAWELHNTAFDYYFLDENCSFQLLTLLDVARPGMNLAANFPLEVIPVDTVRVVLKQKNILSEIKYRPSSRTNLTYWLKQLPEKQQDWVYDYTASQTELNDKRYADLTPGEKAKQLDIAYEYVQYQYRRRILSRKVSATKSLELLTARSRISDNRAVAGAPPPAVRPDQGHLSSRIALGNGARGDKHFVQLNWRPAYHDLLDYDAGHVAGSQINFLDTVVRLYSTPAEYQLERLAIIDIFSITPTNRFFHSLSWHFDTGFERIPDETGDTDRRLVYSINGGAGYTAALSSDLRVYGMLDASAFIHHDYDNSLAMGAGIRAGMLWHVMPFWKLHLSASALDLSYHADSVLQKLAITQNFAVDTNNAVRLSWERSGNKDKLSTQALLSWNHYY